GLVHPREERRVVEVDVTVRLPEEAMGEFHDPGGRPAQLIEVRRDDRTTPGPHLRRGPASGSVADRIHDPRIRGNRWSSLGAREGPGGLAGSWLRGRLAVWPTALPTRPRRTCFSTPTTRSTGGRGGPGRSPRRSGATYRC